MAGMRPFALSGEIASVECESLAATGCPSSQIATDKPTAVPLWKVIVGPAPTNYYRTRKGPVFLWRDRRFDGQAHARGRLPAAVCRPWPRRSRIREDACTPVEAALPSLCLFHPSAFRPAAHVEGTTNGLDHAHARRNLHRPRDQRLPAGRVLIATVSP